MAPLAMKKVLKAEALRRPFEKASTPGNMARLKSCYNILTKQSNVLNAA